MCLFLPIFSPPSAHKPYFRGITFQEADQPRALPINAAGGVGSVGFDYLDAGAGFTVGRANLFYDTVSDEL